MTWVSERNLVAAISNAGGFGVIASGSMSPALLRRDSGDKALTRRPSRQYLITLHPSAARLIDVCADLGVDRVVLPAACRAARPVNRINQSGAGVFCFAPASALRASSYAGRRCNHHRGQRAGGHIGRVFRPVCWRKRFCRISLTSSRRRGIGRASAMLAYLGWCVWGSLGTVFVSLMNRSPIPRFKQAFIPRRGTRCRRFGPARFPLPGDPGSRARHIPATERFVAIQRGSSIGVQRANFRKRSTTRDRALFGGRTPPARVIDGDVEAGSLMAGQSVGLRDREQSTAEILEEL